MQRQIIYVVGIGLVVIAFAAALGLRGSQSVPTDTSSSTTAATGDVTSTQPAPTDSPVARGMVSGHLDIGPNCPGPQVIGKDCKPTPEQYGAYVMQAWDANRTNVVMNAKFDASGNYSMSLLPGTYVIDITPHPKDRLPSISGVPQTVKVTSNSSQKVDVSIDTGIR